MFYCIDVNFYFKRTIYYSVDKTLRLINYNILTQTNYQIILLNGLIPAFMAKTINQLQKPVKKNKNGCNLQ